MLPLFSSLRFGACGFWNFQENKSQRYGDSMVNNFFGGLDAIALICIFILYTLKMYVVLTLIGIDEFADTDGDYVCASALFNRFRSFDCSSKK